MFNIFFGNKGNKIELSIVKYEGKEKYDKNGLKEKFSNFSIESFFFEIKFLIFLLGKFLEIFLKFDILKFLGKLDGFLVEVKG